MKTAVPGIFLIQNVKDFAEIVSVTILLYKFIVQTINLLPSLPYMSTYEVGCSVSSVSFVHTLER